MSTAVGVHFTPGNVALLLLFGCACFHSLANYFYSYYRLVFGTLYPSYASYKAIKTKNIKEYARWMMFWVCFGLFSFVEIFTDVLLGFWLPFYYEIKIIFILWLMSPYGNGARIMYKNVIHPELSKREDAIDSYIDQAKEAGVLSFWQLWAKFADFANAALLNLMHLTHAAILYNLERANSGNGQQALGFRSLFPAILPSAPDNPSSDFVNFNKSPLPDSTSETPLPSQQLYDERMDYLTLDSDDLESSRASSAQAMHIEEFSSNENLNTSADKTVVYDWQEEIPKDESERKSSERRSNSKDKDRPARALRRRNLEQAMRPMIRPALVSTRYKSTMRD